MHLITYAPYATCGKQSIKALGLEAHEMCIKDIMSIVDSREYAPKPVNLRIVLVDL